MKKCSIIGTIAVVGIGFLLASCSNKSIPDKATAVQDFDKNKYLGKWYEIARLDFKFEKGLNNTTAEYSIKDNGMIKVDNKGYDYKKNKWKESIGKAKFVGEENIAMLQVSFFGPFYAGYNVIAIDPDYKYALISGSSLDYLWILSRETTIPEDIKVDYLQKAKKIGFATNDLIWVQQNKLGYK
ncbi:lipocalin family protein [Flavobacterium sp. 7A]|uniref:lipocalin family protein n=1 Tax=Flavobacterium sp. 7A TaxID=2940571 RepID=UPI002226C417|nr:lipocalin family protein [Flavobacterium sp. 7A]MCW2120128.1 apolipoprotein D and lipocalin family protein [Flavobacterium sp. 7A]